MRVGTICKLKVACLGNNAGTLGVIFYDYGDGFQAIFENGNYDGFSRVHRLDIHYSQANTTQTEEVFFLEEVGFEPLLGGYQFKNVIQVSQDFRKGLFDIVWKKWK